MFLVAKCINSLRKPSKFEPIRYPPYPPATTTTRKSKGTSDSDELLTIVEDQSKVPPPAVHPLKHDPCILGSANLYLSWWINENGTLAVSDEIGNRFSTEFSIYQQALIVISTKR